MDDHPGDNATKCSLGSGIAVPSAAREGTLDALNRRLALEESTGHVRLAWVDFCRQWCSTDGVWKWSCARSRHSIRCTDRIILDALLVRVSELSPGLAYLHLSVKWITCYRFKWRVRKRSGGYFLQVCPDDLTWFRAISLHRLGRSAMLQHTRFGYNVV